MEHKRKQEALSEAIRKAYEGKPREEKDAAFDRLSELLRALVRENAGVAADIIDRMFGAETGASVTGTDRIRACMREVNRMCETYGTEPMFPEAESDADDGEIMNALQSYVDHIRS